MRRMGRGSSYVPAEPRNPKSKSSKNGFRSFDQDRLAAQDLARRTDRLETLKAQRGEVREGGLLVFTSLTSFCEPGHLVFGDQGFRG